MIVDCILNKLSNYHLNVLSIDLKLLYTYYILYFNYFLIHFEISFTKIFYLSNLIYNNYEIVNNLFNLFNQ